MKIGILTDIHNNVIALDAVLQEFERQSCEKIVCAGDIIGIGPNPEETVQKMISIPNLIAVRGNHEKYLLEGMPSEYPNDEGMDYDEMEHHKWEHQCLSPSSVEFLRGLPYRVDFHECGKKISVMHYCMNEKNQYVHYTPNPTETDLLELFPEMDQDVVIYGHDHARKICHHQDRWFINSGSLGCPASDKNIARAAILEMEENGHIAVNSIEVAYDVAKVIERIDSIRYPTYREIKKFFYGISEAHI